MRWFKHFGTAMDDLFVKDLERTFDDTGYAFWFKTLELIAAHGRGGVLTISWSNYREKLHKSQKVIRRMLDFCRTSGKLSFTDTGETVTIVCDKFAEFADNYTKYNGLSSKRLQRHFEESSKQEVEEEVDKKEKKIEDSKRPESLAEVMRLFEERNYQNAAVESESFWNYYESNGWRVGKNPMKNWKAAASNWNKYAKQYGGSNGSGRSNNNPNSQAGRASYRPQDAEREAREISESVTAMRRERAERAGADTK